MVQPKPPPPRDPREQLLAQALRANLRRRKEGAADAPPPAAATPSMILSPVSAGELFDKIAILRLKQARLADAAQLANVGRELAELERVADAHFGEETAHQALCDALFAVNAELWTIEDDKRDCERRQDFGDRFVALARAVYLHNDRRAAIKREINRLLGSEIVEEKGYRPY
jgi:hypothetical protein